MNRILLAAVLIAPLWGWSHCTIFGSNPTLKSRFQQIIAESENPIELGRILDEGYVGFIGISARGMRTLLETDLIPQELSVSATSGNKHTRVLLPTGNPEAFALLDRHSRREAIEAAFTFATRDAYLFSEYGQDALSAMNQHRNHERKPDPFLMTDIQDLPLEHLRDSTGSKMGLIRAITRDLYKQADPFEVTASLDRTIKETVYVLAVNLKGKGGQSISNPNVSHGSLIFHGPKMLGSQVIRIWRFSPRELMGDEVEGIVSTETLDRLAHDVRMAKLGLFVEELYQLDFSFLASEFLKRAGKIIGSPASDWRWQRDLLAKFQHSPREDIVRIASDLLDGAEHRIQKNDKNSKTIAIGIMDLLLRVEMELNGSRDRYEALKARVALLSAA